jgi:hypothetical protein
MTCQRKPCLSRRAHLHNAVVSYPGALGDQISCLLTIQQVEGSLQHCCCHLVHGIMSENLDLDNFFLTFSCTCHSVKCCSVGRTHTTCSSKANSKRMPLVATPQKDPCMMSAAGQQNHNLHVRHDFTESSTQLSNTVCTILCFPDSAMSEVPSRPPHAACLHSGQPALSYADSTDACNCLL